MQKDLPPLSLADADAPLSETLSILGNRDFRNRRRILRCAAAAGLVASSPLRALTCPIIPSETEGPFPADGTNGPNVLTETGILRSDIRSSFGSAGSAVAQGTPVTTILEFVDPDNGCGILRRRAVYLWHCDAKGQYSMYSPGITNENYLRGVQVTDSLGQVTFSSIYPACYAGRWPHMHFEVYANINDAISGAKAIKTSQIAMPEVANNAVYAQTELYPSSRSNYVRTSLATDDVFGDDKGLLQTPKVSGTIANGLVISLSVGLRQR